MKIKKTYRLEQETIDELEKLCADNGRSATEVIEGAIHSAIQKQDDAIRGNQPEAIDALVKQLTVKDKQIADLSAALVSAQDTVKAAQALHAANVQQAALESGDHKKRRWPWNKKNG